MNEISVVTVSVPIWTWHGVNMDTVKVGRRQSEAKLLWSCIQEQLRLHLSDAYYSNEPNRGTDLHQAATHIELLQNSNAAV